LPEAPAGVERVVVPSGLDGRVAPRDILEVLAARGLHRVLVEGGGVTVSEFVHADCLDHLHLLIAPLIIGSGRPGLALPPIDRLSEARRPPIRSFPLGNELLVDVRLR
jgi:riboflavin biosynthesis pyrimidine reductase